MGQIFEQSFYSNETSMVCKTTPLCRSTAVRRHKRKCINDSYEFQRPGAANITLAITEYRITTY
jgi:hypothetical protein